MGVLRVWNGTGWDEIKGERGDDGASAYQIAVADGFVGTEQEWLDSLAADPIDPVEIENAVATAIDAEPRISQLVTDTDALATSMATVEPIAGHVSTQRYDVRAYGSIGTSDDSQTFQDALDDIAGNGGGVLTGPMGFYQFAGPIAHPAGVTVDFPLGTVFDFTSATGNVNGAMWYGGGSQALLPALAANIPINGRTVSFASPHGLSPGDWVAISNSADYSWSTERAVYRAGEYVQVQDVPTSTTITTVSPTYDAYASGSTVSAYKLQAAVFQISGIHFEIPNTAVAGMIFDLATRLVLNNVSANGSQHALFGIRRSVNLTIDKPTAWSTSAAVGTNYGLQVQNCQNVTVNDANLQTTRHGFSTGGGVGEALVINRNIRVTGGTISSTGETVSGFDFHGNTEWAWVDNVTMPKGMHIGGNHVYVSKTCRIQSGGNGIALNIINNVGWDIEVEAEIEATREVYTDGLVCIIGRPETVRGGRMRIGGRVIIGVYRTGTGSARGIYIDNQGTGQGHVEITAHVSATGTTAGNNILGLWVRATTGTAFGMVRLNGAEFWECGASVNNTGLAFVERTISRSSPLAGVSVSATNIHSRDNHVRNAGTAGLSYTGGGLGVGEIHSLNDTSLDNNASGAGTNSNTSILILNTGECVYRGATIGDTRSTPMQTRADQINNVTRLHTEPAAILGTVTTQNRSGIGTTVNV